MRGLRKEKRTKELTELELEQSKGSNHQRPQKDTISLQKLLEQGFDTAGCDITEDTPESFRLAYFSKWNKLSRSHRTSMSLNDDYKMFRQWRKFLKSFRANKHLHYLDLTNL